MTGQRPAETLRVRRIAGRSTDHPRAPFRTDVFNRYLANRGISEETADRCLLRSVDPEEHAEAVGQPGLLRKKVWGGLIPFFGLNGDKIDFRRTRVLGADFTPNKSKKPAKFLQPPDTASHLYLPPILHERGIWKGVACDPKVPLLITEGEFKAIKACQEGLVCLALTGVWNFLSRGESGGESALMGDLALFDWKGRAVYIVFDSDAATNPNVRKAEERLMRALYGLGARPFVVRLPSLPGVGKTGLDDFYVERGRRARPELDTLIAEAKSPFVPKVLGTAAMTMMALTPPEFAVRGLLPKGASLLAALPKIGKSFFALQAAHAIATGGSFSAYAVQPSEVLYLALEDSHYRIQSRLEKMGLEPTDDLKIATAWPRGDDGYEALTRYLQENPGTRAVFIDTWQKIRRAPSSRSENAYQNDYAELASLKGIADRFSCAILLIHHLKKGLVSDVFEGVLGSTAITGALDTVLVLQRTRNENQAVLHVTGRDIIEQELAAEFSATDCKWKILGPAAQFHLSRQRNAVVELLREANRPMQLKDIASELSTSSPNARKMLRGLIADRLIEQTSDGLYRYCIKEPPRPSVRRRATTSMEGKP